MNKTRRRIGKARRKKARLIREIREWTATNWTAPPKRGRLRRPVVNLMSATNAAIDFGLRALGRLMAPVMAFGRRADAAGEEKEP